MHYMNLLFISIGLLAIAVIVLGFFAGFLYKKMQDLTRGTDAASLESVIKENNKLIIQLQKQLDIQNTDILTIQKDAVHNIQNIGIVRFNPFKETGGSQSFAIALTDKNKTGVVISSLYARERINVFAKPITNGISEHTLTNEEQSAINKSHL